MFGFFLSAAGAARKMNGAAGYDAENAPDGCWFKRGGGERAVRGRGAQSTELRAA
jgi:hypothetical protein